MKKVIAVLVAASFLLAGCGKPKNIGGTEYPTYGIANQGSSMSKNVCYELSVGNVVWSILLVETLIFPIYFVGFSLWNPVRLKKGPEDQCTFDS